MAELATRYMGLELAHPIVASGSPISQTLDGIKRLEDSGAAAIVMFSLFEEQIRAENAAIEHLTMAGADSFGEALSYFPEAEIDRVGPEPYLELIRRASASTDIPIIASLNGVTDEGWTDYAKLMQEAGAKGIELNVYYIAADATLSGAQVEQRYIDVLRAVKNTVTIPVAMKLGPYFSAFANMAHRLDEAGADALVLFNRFYQPDFDLERLDVAPNLNLSRSQEGRLPLMWIGLLSGTLRSSIAATTGVHTAEDGLKYIAAGADIAMTTSALLAQGPAHIGELRDGIKRWLDDHGYASIDQLRGTMSHRNAADPSAFERANYLRVLDSVRELYLQN